MCEAFLLSGSAACISELNKYLKDGYTIVDRFAVSWEEFRGGKELAMSGWVVIVKKP